MTTRTEIFKGVRYLTRVIPLDGMLAKVAEQSLHDDLSLSVKNKDLEAIVLDSTILCYLPKEVLQKCNDEYLTSYIKCNLISYGEH